MLSFLESVIVGTFVQGLLYGLYLATLMHAVRWLAFADEGWVLRKFRAINWPMLVITTLIFLMMTADLGLSFHVILYVIRHKGKSKGIDLVITAFLENATRMIVDGTLIYRCYIVYGQSIGIIIMPVILLVGSIGCLIVYTYENVRILYGQLPNFALLHIIEAIYSCNVAITVFTTSAIVYKIWRVSRSSSSSKRSLGFSMRVIAESGMLFTFTSILLISVMFEYSPRLEAAQLVLSGINFSMTGVAFNLIILRVFKHRVKVDNITPASKQISTIRFNVPMNNSTNAHSSLSHESRTQSTYPSFPVTSSKDDLERGRESTE
ncbi:hypothetical protein AMATHDRAFT_72070 [Amanita thiersii Skay4041]|uniref:Uncharacterized protein n=1 Tax=Amanita thiersii Skay4041 TaxID=703135 RepID=A0A2A9N9X1_9AGAR|nr:hypothetical protein AMATHDRAFT_72070 [Amanita thiersii Skay4041]